MIYPQVMQDALPDGAIAVYHRSGPTWNDGGYWHRIVARLPDGKHISVKMETDYRPTDLIIENVDQWPSPTFIGTKSFSIAAGTFGSGEGGGGLGTGAYVRKTGNLRFLNGRLQQEYASIENNGQLRVEWHDVSSVEES